MASNFDTSWLKKQRKYDNKSLKEEYESFNSPLAPEHKTPLIPDVSSKPDNTRMVELSKKVQKGEATRDEIEEFKNFTKGYGSSKAPSIADTVVGGVGSGIVNPLKGLTTTANAVGDLYREKVYENENVPAPLKVLAGLNPFLSIANANALVTKSDKVDEFKNNLVAADEQIKQATKYDQQKGAQKVTTDVISSIPQMALNFLPGGPILFGESAAGNYYDEAKQKGATDWEAMKYGAIGGTAEVGLNKVLGIVPGYKNLFKEGAKATVKEVGKQAAKEALEEGAIDPVMGLAEKKIYNPDKKWFGDEGVVDLKQIGYDALVGGLMGGAMGGPALFKGSKNVNSKVATEQAQEEVASTTEPVQSNPIQGKFAVKNVALEKAKQEWDSFVELAQNKYGHYKLTQDEILEVAAENNIDPFQLLDNIDKASKGVNMSEVGERARIATVAGVNENIPSKLQVPEFKTKSNLIPRVGKTSSIGAKIEMPKVESDTLNIPLNQSNSTPKVDSNGIMRPDEKIVSSDKGKKFNFKDAYNKFYTRFVDINNPINKFSKESGDNAYIKATNSKNAGGTVDYILTNGLVDRQGKTIGKSLKELVNDIPKGQESEFWEYALQKHNIDRAAQGKNVYSKFDSLLSADAAAKWEKLHPDWKAKADNVTKWIDTFMQEWGVNAGTLDETFYNQLRETYPNYLPTNRDFDDLEEFMPNTNGRGFVDQKKPVKKATGSSRDIIDPTENIMNLVNRTVRTARYNEVAQTILDSVRINPEKLKPLAEIVQGEPNPNLKNIVTVLENGKPVNLQINDKMLLESLNGLYKNVDDFKIAQKFTNAYKALITQKNPVFAIRNIARDIPTAYVYGNEKNPIKFLADLAKAGKDLATNAPVAQQYKALGGGGSNFFNSQNPAKSAKELTKKNPLQKISGAIEVFNNLTESAPRLAEFKRTLEKTGDTQQALYDAADVTTNFSRGGDIIKKYDRIVPYLNAGFQGLDKMGRQFVNHPIGTILKGATIVTLPSLILNAINKDDEDYKALDNRTKDNNFLIPTGDGKFIKIPKSRELGVLFGVLAERSLRQAQGDSEAYKGLKNTVASNFSPTNPIENNILSPLAFNIPTNKDFAGRAIVPEYMTNRTHELQYDETTSEVAKAMGELTGKSPKQIDYIIKSYTGVIGQLMLPATTKKNYEQGNALQKTFNPITNQFLANPLYSNQAITDFYDNKAKLTTKNEDFEFKSLPPKPDGMSDYQWSKEKPRMNEYDIYKLFNSTSDTMSDIRKEIKKVEESNASDKATKAEQLRQLINKLAADANKAYNNSSKSSIMELNDELDKLKKIYK